LCNGWSVIVGDTSIQTIAQTCDVSTSSGDDRPQFTVRISWSERARVSRSRPELLAKVFSYIHGERGEIE
jgi:hypothetical protein